MEDITFSFMIVFNPKGPSTKSTVMGNRKRLSIYSISVKAKSKQSKSIKVNKDNIRYRQTIQESMNTKISKNNTTKNDHFSI